MHVLILDGHPDEGRLVSHLLDHYQTSLGEGTTVTRINVRQLVFSPDLKRGYASADPWEADLRRVAEALAACDHIVVGFPLWWGAEPALLKGLVDRVLMPGFAFKYHRDNPWWDRLLSSRSADLVVTMDTPPLFLWLTYGDSVMKRWRRQVLGFCGFKPIRVFRLGPTRQGGAAKNIEKWKQKLAAAARTAGEIRRGTKNDPWTTGKNLKDAIADRMA